MASEKLTAIMSRLVLRPTWEERKQIMRDLYEHAVALEEGLDAARAEVERLRGVLGETLDRLLAFVDRDEHDSDDLAILDATIAKARRARRGGSLHRRRL